MSESSSNRPRRAAGRHDLLATAESENSLSKDPLRDALADRSESISERTGSSEAEKAASIAAEALRQVAIAFEALPDGVAIVDSQWRFTFANQRAQEIVGRADLAGRNIFELFPGNLKEPFYSTYHRAMTTREPGEFEAFHGEPLNLWFRVQAKPYTQGIDDGILVFFSDVSERKRSEQREQETARRLAQVLEVTSDAIASIDRGWRYTYLNSKAQHLIDPENRLLGKNIWEGFPLATGGRAREIFESSMNDAKSEHAEIFYPAPLNVWLHICSEPTADGIVVFFRDVTEQRKHDEIVRGQQELLASVQAAAKMATWDFDPATDMLRYEVGSYQIFGYPNAQLSTLSQLSALMIAGQKERVRAEMERCLQAHGPMFVEFGIISQSGETIWVEARGEAYETAEGLARVRGLMIDVTRRYLDQQDLVASEARYRVLADLNPQAIWMGDAQGTITYANHGFMAYLGLGPGDLGTSRWLEAFAPGERTRIQAAWAHSVATGEPYDVEALLCQAQTREYRYWHLRALAVRDTSGAILHWLGIGQDIHEAKTYTAALRAEQMETERRRAELESIYTTTPIGLALFTPDDLTFINLNDHEAQMLGVPREELIGKPLAQVASPERVPEVFALLRKAASGTPIRNPSPRR